MATVAYTAQDISRQLNDQQVGYSYTRWTRAMIISYITDALAQVGLYRPDAFSTTVTFSLVPGAAQRVPEGMSLLSAVIGSNGEANNVSKDDLNLIRVFNKRVCDFPLDEQGNVIYKVSSFSYDPKNPSIFFVSPPVPEGIPAPTVTVNGTVSPPILGNADWNKELPVDNKYYNAIIAWALSKAYEVDVESNASFQQMQFHRADFYRMMGIKYQQEAKYNSGWYLGSKGNDSQVKGQQ